MTVPQKPSMRNIDAGRPSGLIVGWSPRATQWHKPSASDYDRVEVSLDRWLAMATEVSWGGQKTVAVKVLLTLSARRRFPRLTLMGQGQGWWALRGVT